MAALARGCAPGPHMAREARVTRKFSVFWSSSSSHTDGILEPRMAPKSRNPGRVCATCFSGARISAFVLVGKSSCRVFSEAGGHPEGSGTLRRPMNVFPGHFALNPRISGIEDKTAGLGYFSQILIENINLISPDTVSVDTGREWVGRHRKCLPPSWDPF